MLCFSLLGGAFNQLVARVNAAATWTAFQFRRLLLIWRCLVHAPTRLQGIALGWATGALNAGVRDANKTRSRSIAWVIKQLFAVAFCILNANKLFLSNAHGFRRKRNLWPDSMRQPARGACVIIIYEAMAMQQTWQTCLMNICQLSLSMFAWNFCQAVCWLFLFVCLFACLLVVHCLFDAPAVQAAVAFAWQPSADTLLHACMHILKTGNTFSNRNALTATLSVVLFLQIYSIYVCGIWYILPHKSCLNNAYAWITLTFTLSCSRSTRPQFLLHYFLTFLSNLLDNYLWHMPCHGCNCQIRVSRMPKDIFAHY